VLSYVYAVDCSLHRHPLLWCQQHVVHPLETEPLQLLDHAHATTSDSDRQRLLVSHLSPSRNISRHFIQLIFLEHESDYSLRKGPLCNAYSRLQHYHFVNDYIFTLSITLWSIMLITWFVAANDTGVARGSCNPADQSYEEDWHHQDCHQSPIIIQFLRTEGTMSRYQHQPLLSSPSCAIL